MKQLHRFFDVVIVGAVAIVAVGFGALLDAKRTPPNTIAMGGMVFNAEVVSSGDALERGLSGRNTLTPDAAMLFAFKENNTWCFWMKDMQFSLDIIWLDEAKRIVHIEPELSPGSYPAQYCPVRPARYVVEVLAGTAMQLELKTGDQVSFAEP